MIDSFLKPKGRRSLLFFYQEIDQEGPSCKYNILKMYIVVTHLAQL